MIHLTTPGNAEIILTQGLKTDMPRLLGIPHPWVQDWYGTTPIYLAWPDAPFLTAIRENFHQPTVTLEVDTAGFDMLADLESLMDTGARYGIDQGFMFWPAGRHPPLLAPFMDASGAIEISSLIDPSTDACKAAVFTTLTTAITTFIPPERIRLARAS